MPKTTPLSNKAALQECVTYWQNAKPGQWFIGVCNTACDTVRIVPINVFDTREGQLDKATLKNTSERAMNRYASGAPGERGGTSDMPAWLTNRASGMTHHVAAALYYKMVPNQTWGFSLVKYGDSIAQLKTASNSLNSKPTNPTPRPYSFSHATRRLGRDMQDMTADERRNAKRENNADGSKPMPPTETGKLVKHLAASPFKIINIAVHGATIGGTNHLAQAAVDASSSSSTTSSNQN